MQLFEHLVPGSWQAINWSLAGERCCHVRRVPPTGPSPGSLAGAVYEFVNQAVVPGVTYWY